MDNREEARPPSGRKAGSEVGFMREHFLDPYNVAYGILNPLTGAPVALDLDLGAAMATAANDWQVAEWLEPEPRLRASIVVATEDPMAAAAEIRRCSADRRFVQVLFMGRFQEPMGRRKYWPIYEACAEGGLHVATHAFGAYGHPITGAGHASYYIEDHTSPPQAVQANITSLVLEGVFDRFPDLKLISVENGFGWVPPLMWRLDASWKLLRSEVPNLERLPSEVITEHVYVTTQPVEEPPRPQDFLTLLEHFGEMVDHILLASDYPHWDGDNPDFVLPNSLTEEATQKIRYDNASLLYGLA
jgi:predicted TIM-barrel fold metal-dependent hydrolase